MLQQPFQLVSSSIGLRGLALLAGISRTKQYCGCSFTQVRFRVTALISPVDFALVMEEMLTNNRIWKQRLVDIGVVTADQAMDFVISSVYVSNSITRDRPRTTCCTSLILWHTKRHCIV